MRIYLVRHGQSLSNIDKSLHKTMPDHAIGLSQQGVVDAQRAGRLIEDNLSRKHNPWPHVRLWTSPYARTRQTADEVEKILSPWIKDRREHPLLCEQQFGLFDGLSDEELHEQFPVEHNYYKKCESREGRFWARMPLGESRFDVACRVHQAFGTFQRDSDKHNIDTIIVVCHGVTLRAFVMMWCHKTPEWFEAEENPDNGSVRVIQGADDLGYLPFRYSWEDEEGFF